MNDLYIYAWDRDVILAGLRLLQEAVLADRVREEIADIATNWDEHEMPTAERIDELCEVFKRASRGA